MTFVEREVAVKINVGTVAVTSLHVEGGGGCPTFERGGLLFRIRKQSQPDQFDHTMEVYQRHRG